MYNVDYSYDQLRVCAVGRAYPPEFYSFIHDPKIRSTMERIASETEEDYQELIKLLHSFGVETIRTSIPTDFPNHQLSGKYFPAPMTPRDHCGMIGNKFFISRTTSKWNMIRGERWPKLPPQTDQEFKQLPDWLLSELKYQFGVTNTFECYDFDHSGLAPIERLIKQQGNDIIYDKKIDTAMCLRLGQDLIFGTWPGENIPSLERKVKELFPDNNCYIIDSQGHIDGCVFVPKSGVVVARDDIELGDYFKDWKVISATSKLGSNIDQFLKLKQLNQGKWWVPGEEQNESFTQYVEDYFQHWIGDIEETTIDVNMLSIDKNNVICINNNQLAETLAAEGITVYPVRLRHHTFWDGGVHCATNDLDRTRDL